MALTFEWDENKSKQNFNKHGVTFVEAKTVFNDPFAITIEDPDHSAKKTGILTLGSLLREKCW